MSFNLEFVQDSTSLSRSLGVHVNAVYKTGIWNHEASADYVSSSSMTSDSAYLVLTVKVEMHADTPASVNLTSHALDLLATDPVGFVASCGDQFVSSTVTGGLLRIVYQYEGLSASQKSDLGAKISLAWSSGGSFSVGLQQTMEEASSHYRTRVWYDQSGGVVPVIPIDPASMIAYARTYGANASGSPVVNCGNATVIGVGTRPYYTVANFPTQVRYPNVQQQADALSTFAADYGRVLQFKNDLASRKASLPNLHGTECASDLSLFEDREAVVSEFLATTQAKLLACEEVQPCGPSAQCTQRVAVPDTHLWPLVNPVVCGPRCTDGGQSTYEVDDYGYCTRCTWSWPATTTAGSGNINQSACRYMRPGAITSVRAFGPVGALPGCSNPTNMGVWEVAASGANQSLLGCGYGNTPCSYVDTNWFNSSYIDLRDEIMVAPPVVVNGAAAPTTVSASIYQSAFCSVTNQKGLVFLPTWKIDFCDESRSEGCCLVAADRCTADSQCCSGTCAGAPNGRCSATCPLGSVACGETCVDPRADPRNCGSCGHACAVIVNAVPACASGQCVLACAAGYSAVNGRCVPSP